MGCEVRIRIGREYTREEKELLETCLARMGRVVTRADEEYLRDFGDSPTIIELGSLVLILMWGRDYDRYVLEWVELTTQY